MIVQNSFFMVVLVASLAFFTMFPAVFISKAQHSECPLCSPRIIYVLCINEAGESWVQSKDLFAQELVRVLKEALERAGINAYVQVIRSIDEWSALVRSGPEGAVVINAHGELIPLPDGYSSDWKRFYARLAELVRENGWIFINPAGLGFYYIGNKRIEEIGEKKAIGLNGSLYIGAVLGISFTPFEQYEWSGSSYRILHKCKITDTGRKIFSFLSLNMPEEMDIEWPVLMNEAPQSWLYELRLENGLIGYAGAVLRAGKGALCWGGLTARPLDEKAKIAAALAVLAMEPELLAQLPASSEETSLFKKEILIVTIIIGIIAFLITLMHKYKKIMLEINYIQNCSYPLRMLSWLGLNYNTLYLNTIHICDEWVNRCRGCDKQFNELTSTVSARQSYRLAKLRS